MDFLSLRISSKIWIVQTSTSINILLHYQVSPLHVYTLWKIAPTLLAWLNWGISTVWRNLSCKQAHGQKDKEISNVLIGSWVNVEARPWDRGEWLAVSVGAYGAQRSTSDRMLEELHCTAADHDERGSRQSTVHLPYTKQNTICQDTLWKVTALRKVRQSHSKYLGFHSCQIDISILASVG